MNSGHFHIRAIATCFSAALALGACAGEREKDLRDNWKTAVQTDTIDGYLAFLAEQDPSEDAKAGKHRLHGKRKETRGRIAQERIFELAVQPAEGSCPFQTLYVDLEQSIRNVEQEFFFPLSGPGDVLERVGVEYHHSPDADETLSIRLHGTGTEATYSPMGRGGGEATTMVGGGRIDGSAWFAKHEDKVAHFRGEHDLEYVLSSVALEYRDVSFPVGLRVAMDNAGFTEKFAHIIYDICGVETAALVYFGDGVKTHTSANLRDTAFEALLDSHSEQIRPIVIAASFGSQGHTGYYGASEKAVRYLLPRLGDDDDELDHALRYSRAYQAYSRTQ